MSLPGTKPTRILQRTESRHRVDSTRCLARAVYADRVIAKAGGLMSYERAGQMPIARLGLTIPLPLLSRADEVIE